jgi:hypothetical protein
VSPSVMQTVAITICMERKYTRDSTKYGIQYGLVSKRFSNYTVLISYILYVGTVYRESLGIVLVVPCKRLGLHMSYRITLHNRMHARLRSLQVCISCNNLAV